MCVVCLVVVEVRDVRFGTDRVGKLRRVERLTAWYQPPLNEGMLRAVVGPRRTSGSIL